MAGDIFIDTNILLYLFSHDQKKAAKADKILQQSPHISVQVLNELTNVVRKKLLLPWNEVNEILNSIKSLCQVHPISITVHTNGLEVAEKYGFSVYDSMILSSALEANCRMLYSEDMQHNQIIHKTLKIVNPFV
jgi:predicted nucleic acid-binding protein